MQNDQSRRRRGGRNLLHLSPSLARIQISKPKYEAVVRQLSDAMPEYDDVKGTLRLPSEDSNEDKTTFEFDGLVEQPDKTDQPVENPVVHRPRSNDELDKKPNVQNLEFEGEKARPKSNDNEAEARLIDLKRNSLFRLRSGVPYRLCRHNHLHHIEETVPDGPQLEFPFGHSGAVLSLAEDADFKDQAVFRDDSVSQGRTNRIPFQDHLHDANEASNRLSTNNHDRFSEVERRWAKFIHHYHHHHGPRHLRRHKGKVWTHLAGNDEVKTDREVELHNNEKNESGSLRKRIRKFLGQYFG